MGVSELKHLDSHSLEIVQRIYQTNCISSVTHLIGIEIMLEGSPIDVVIRGVAINKSIDEQCVDGEPPVVWRREESVVFPFSPIVHRVCCRLVLIQIVLDPILIIWPALRRRREEGEPDSGQPPLHRIRPLELVLLQTQHVSQKSLDGTRRKKDGISLYSRTAIRN